MNKIYVRNHVKVMTLVIEKTIKIYAKKFIQGLILVIKNSLDLCKIHIKKIIFVIKNLRLT